MRILGIETSCDETSIAIVEDGVRVLSNVIATSKASFAGTTGVIPEEAARKQVECILPVLHASLADARITQERIDAIAVTRGPGLLGSLLVGTVTARALAALWKKPLVGVHHTLGHLSSVWLEADPAPSFPSLTLSASGGHTELWLRTGHTDGVLLGATRDDAAGEAFDKGASLLGLPYPGGPSISRAGASGNPEAFAFPMPLEGAPGFDFSFSGLKTSLKYTLRDVGPEESEKKKRDLAASFEYAICRHLLSRIERALKAHSDVCEAHVVGGASANTRLRAMLSKLGRPVRFPTKISYCTDNAAMIASAGYFLIKERGEKACTAFETTASLPQEALAF